MSGGKPDPFMLKLLFNPFLLDPEFLDLFDPLLKAGLSKRLSLAGSALLEELSDSLIC
jgi:hypothetical protein